MLKKQLGFSMLEVLITIVITTVGLLGIVSLQLQSNRSIQDSGNRSQAMWILKDLANRMNANSTALTEYATTAYSCSSTPVMCEDYYSNGNVTATSCSAEQVAAFDLWDVACGRGFETQGKKIRSSHADFISNPKLSVTVDTAKKSAVLKLTWDVRTSGESAGGKNYMVDPNSNAALTDSITRDIQL